MKDFSLKTRKMLELEHLLIVTSFQEITISIWFLKTPTEDVLFQTITKLYTQIQKWKKVF